MTLIQELEHIERQINDITINYSVSKCMTYATGPSVRHGEITPAGKTALIPVLKKRDNILFIFKNN